MPPRMRLTFDDGPSEYTEQLLSVVERVNARLSRAPEEPVVLLHDGRGDRSATVEAVKRLLASSP